MSDSPSLNAEPSPPEPVDGFRPPETPSAAALPAADPMEAASRAAEDEADGDSTPLPDDAAPNPETAIEAEAETGTGTDLPAQHPVPPAVPTLSPAACAARMVELFPAVFTPGAAKPLKLRIQADIQQRAPGTFSRKALSLFLQRHTTSTAYLRALSRQPQRIDLDGQPAGEVSEEHRQAATAELNRRQALHEERRAAERLAQRQAQDAVRRQQAAEGEALRNRAALLRAFETSTLTRANFCALKNLSEVELEAQLVLARREREQSPPPAARPERPAPRPGERDRRPPHGGRPAPRGAGRPKAGP